MEPSLRWGILGTARIATKKVIPGLKLGVWTRVAAIASRDQARADAAARDLDIPKAYGSYEALLADPDIDVVYIPLPNHLHVPWTIRAAEAGKHVVCEKPIALSADEARTLIAVRDRTGVRIQEAFMVRTHPQWEKTLDLCGSGAIGEVRAYLGAFSYFNDDPANIRNIAEWGGGGLMDIGCYLVMTSRLVFGEEPIHASARLSVDPVAHVDTLASLTLEYPSGHAVGICGTRMTPYQRVQVIGTRGRLEIEVPFNSAPDRPSRMWVDDGRDPFGGGRRGITIGACDQYRVQGDRFSLAILEKLPQPYPLEESIANMTVIDALFQSARSGRAEPVS